MQPINNFQNQSAEYSALETAISLCGDATLKAMMMAKLQGLAKQMSTQTQSSTPQSSFTASTAAAASPALTTIAASAFPSTQNAAQKSSSEAIEALLKSNPEFPGSIFGADQWEKYVGAIVGEIPPLPVAEIDKILNSNNNKHTHILTLVPKEVLVDGKIIPITLSSLLQMLAKPKNGGHGIENWIFKPETIKDDKVSKSHWVLLRKEVFKEPSSVEWESHIPYHTRQENTVNSYSQQTNTNYQLPTAIDAAASCFLHYVMTGKAPYNQQIRCLDKAQVGWEPNSDNWDRGNYRPVQVGFSHKNKTFIGFSHGWAQDNLCVNVAVAKTF